MRKLIVLLFILCILFISSGQTYEQQSIVPMLQKWLPQKPFEDLLSMYEIPYWGIIVSVEERGYYYFVEFLIRKSAHFFIFGFLAIAIYYVLPRNKYRIIMAASITSMAAVLDEYRQSLTGGRTQSLQDMMLDTAGAVTALILLHFFRILQHRKTKKIH